MRRVNTDWGYYLLVAACGLLVLAAVYGYVANVIAAIHSEDALVPMFIFRCIGVFVPPLGVILGFVG